MIAVLIASSVPSSAFWTLAAISIGAMGLGPLASWIATLPLLSLKRITVATLLAIFLMTVFVLGEKGVHALRQEVISCDFSWDMELICWLFGLG